MGNSAPHRVYFIRPIGGGPVKIGCSHLPDKRLKSMMHWSPMPLEIVVTIPGSYALERNVQDCFADLHMHHEWFRPEMHLLELIEKLKAGIAIESALDLSARIANIRVTGARSDNVRLRVSYLMKLSWATRRAEKILGVANMLLPNDVEKVARAWRGYSERPSVIPTLEQFARLDAIIADPAAHCVISPCQPAKEVRA